MGEARATNNTRMHTHAAGMAWHGYDLNEVNKPLPRSEKHKSLTGTKLYYFAFFFFQIPAMVCRVVKGILFASSSTEVLRV